MLYSLGSRSAERLFVLVFANDFCLHGFFLQLLLLFVPGRKGFVVLFCYAGKKEKHRMRERVTDCLKQLCWLDSVEVVDNQ